MNVVFNSGPIRPTGGDADEQPFAFSLEHGERAGDIAVRADVARRKSGGNLGGEFGAKAGVNTIQRRGDVAVPDVGLVLRQLDIADGELDKPRRFQASLGRGRILNDVRAGLKKILSPIAVSYPPLTLPTNYPV